MASYPSGVKVFTTKVDGAGNKIFASYVNDLQDEVSAIEAGLLNGTAPLTSSNASVQGLQVNLGSTFIGTLQCSSNINSSGQITAPNQPAWNVYSTVTQSGGAGSTLSIPFESETIDQGGFHSTAASTSAAIVVPAGSSGLYWIQGSVLCLTANAAFGVYLTKNSSREAAVVSITTVNATANLANLMRLDAGDNIRLEVSVGASTWSAGSQTRGFESRLMGVKVS